MPLHGPLRWAGQPIAPTALLCLATHLDGDERRATYGRPDGGSDSTERKALRVPWAAPPLARILRARLVVETQGGSTVRGPGLGPLEERTRHLREAGDLV
jgi:hypothetical protein